MDRYEWRKPSDLPAHLELIDTITRHPIGIFLGLGRKWHWQRRTTVLLHGAPPTEGICGQLNEAKERLLDGLPR
jgi:hypothetical protein